MTRCAWLLSLLMVGLLAGCAAQPDLLSVPITPTPPGLATAQATAAPAGVTRAVRINAGAFPDNLDPQQLANENEISHVALLYEPLVALDADLKPIPAAAESWQVLDDGRTYIFKLRPGLKYSDGQPLTAKDYEYAFKRAADPLVGGQLQSDTFDIEGAEAYATADVTTLSPAELTALRDRVGVHARDDTTLEFRLVKPAPYFPFVVSTPIGYPVREDMVARGENWHLKAGNQIGNGPFMLQELNETAGRAVFVPNPNWRGPQPMADGIVVHYLTDPNVALQAYRNGELDIVRLSASQLPAVHQDAALSKQVVVTPGACTDGFAFNQTRPPFDRRDVRLAFAKAFDRERYAQAIAGGLATPSLSWLPKGAPGYDPTIGRAQLFDPTAARQLLAAAGYPDGQGLPEIKLNYPATPQGKTVAEFIAAQYQQNLGIQLVLEPLDLKQFAALGKDVTTLPPFVNAAWCGDYPDPHTWFTAAWRSTAPMAKVSGYKNVALDELMAAADTEPDASRRLEMYQHAERMILDEDVAFLPVTQGETAYLIKPDVVYGRTTSHDKLFPGWFEPWQLGRR
ncbi:MAG: peptide ABC transporter substrate-binding protein [Anaerolineae bacterium]